jgi:hypothetical protein
MHTYVIQVLSYIQLLRPGIYTDYTYNLLT